MRHDDYGTEDLLAVAHRGGAAHAPENTWAAFEHARLLGYDYLETDVRATSDGVPVALHDAALGRVTGAAGPVSKRSFAELDRFRVDGNGPIPRIEDLLGAWPDARWMLDLKTPSALGPLVRAIRRTGTERRVCLAGTWDRWLSRAAHELPAAQTALGWNSVGALLSGTLRDRRTAAFVHLPLRLAGQWLISDRLIDRTHRLGIRLVVWGAEDTATMQRLLDVGVDGLITDHTSLLRQVLLGADRWHTTPSPLPGMWELFARAPLDRLSPDQR